MRSPNDSQEVQPRVSTQAIQRAIWIAFALFIIVVVAFAGYYIWDRYIHLGDQSPVELGLEHVKKAVQEDPQNVEARVVLADSYLAAGQYRQALDQANQVLGAYPDNVSALLIAGIAAVRLDEPKVALEPLEAFVALRKDQPMAGVDTALEAAYYFLGESYVKLNRPGDAISALEAALAISPTDADALHQLGQAYQASDQPEKALEQYHQAVRFVPDFAEVYGGMVESYTALGQSDYEAYARGMEAYSLEDYAAAQTQLELAIGALPDFAPVHVGLGLTYEKLGQLEAALTLIERALVLNPGDFVAQQAMGRIQNTLNSQN
jgi:tetratricopeptide (TPR) repeat protein